MESKTLVDQIVPHLLAIVAIILPPLLTWIAAAVSKGNKIAADKNSREALHSALRSGVEAELERNPHATSKELMVAGIHHAREGVPDAISRIPQAKSPNLERIALSKVYQARQEPASVES